MGDPSLSVKIEPAQIEGQLAGRDFVYLVTNNGTTTHVVALRPHISGNVLRLTATGRTPLANVANHGAVTLVWPPCDATQSHEHARYSVVADGHAVVEGDEIVVTVTNAVLHRPA